MLIAKRPALFHVLGHLTATKKEKKIKLCKKFIRKDKLMRVI